MTGQSAYQAFAADLPLLMTLLVTQGPQVLAIVLALFIGFAAHRASLCTVRAVGEVMSSGKAWILASFAKAVIWVCMIYGTLLLLHPASASIFIVYEPRALTLAGGFIFGVGAAINRGCSLSTVQRLAEGDLGMLATFAGLFAGITAWTLLDLKIALVEPVAAPLIWHSIGVGAPILVGVLWLLAGFEIIRLWRSRPANATIGRLLLKPAYRQSTAALIIGISGGLLYGLLPAWTYSNYLRTAVDTTLRDMPSPAALQGWLFAALVTGMVASAIQRGSMRLRIDGGARQIPMRLAGGMAMGIGASMIPGGNDTLILTSIPTLSLWALAAYAALLLGIACVMGLHVLVSGAMPVIRCENDVCSEAAGDAASRQ